MSQSIVLNNVSFEVAQWPQSLKQTETIIDEQLPTVSPQKCESPCCPTSCPFSSASPPTLLQHHHTYPTKDGQSLGTIDGVFVAHKVDCCIHSSCLHFTALYRDRVLI
jgi:hypothetical protein